MIAASALWEWGRFAGDLYSGTVLLVFHDPTSPSGHNCKKTIYLISACHAVECSLFPFISHFRLGEGLAVGANILEKILPSKHVN